MLALIKIAGNKASILFRIKDITRITPILLDGKLDCYGLDLTCEPHRIKLSPAQFDRLIPFLSYVDLSRDLEEELTAPLEEEDFDRTISDLLDMAIESQPSTPNPWLLVKKWIIVPCSIAAWRKPPLAGTSPSPRISKLA